MKRTSPLSLRLLLPGMLVLLLGAGGPVFASDDSFGSWKSAAEDWIAKTRDIYTLNERALQMIWEAYCGQLDTSYGEETDDAKKFATEIGYSWQQQELEQMNKLRPVLAELKKRADDLRSADPSSEGDVKTLLENLGSEEKKLNALDDGLVLKGSGHPFVQFALEYGKKAHADLCSSASAVVKVCDRTFDGLSGQRPDLVLVNGDGLWVYEFKPDNRDQISKGEKQLDAYAPAIAAYYQKFFLKGRHGGFDGEPDSDHGGAAMLKAIDDESDAWHGDTQLEVRRAVVTYQVCEKPF
ncbi:hypothetical protein GCM10022631_34180 [Deinococcus rubellus]|uniref:Tox-REase-9 domain-containing protein n=1 Tax=Deinococcus rubellus TaxID=1889240 RepID=A0ABY5YH98_9DEIO|nr:hypothetical protein [Deinococcus rubellus]UWX63477.1 hypothetical protein N0D28_12090 [Deinococcus rubellus]